MKKEIIIKGKAYPVSFGIRAQKEAARIVGGDLGEIMGGEISPEKGFDLMLGVALVSLNEGSRKSGSSVRYSEDQVVDMMDDDPKFISQIEEMFSESQNVDLDKLGDLGESSPREEMSTTNGVV